MWHIKLVLLGKGCSGYKRVRRYFNIADILVHDKKGDRKPKKESWQLWKKKQA